MKSGLQVHVALAAVLSCAGAVEAQVQVIGPEPVSVDESKLPERHQVVADETLSILAERYLGNGDAWPKLWSYNPEITNPHWIYPGLVVRLKAGVPLEASGQAPTTVVGGAPAGGMKTLQFASRRHANAGTGAVLIGEEVYLDGTALTHAGKIVGAPEDHIMLAIEDEVYLKFKSSEPQPNQELTVFLRQPKKTVAPPPNEQGPGGKMTSRGGELVRVVGALRIKDFDADKKIARAVIVEALEPIERGFEVTEVPRRLALVPPRKNGKDLKGHIVASSRGLGQLGKEQVVFLDLGAQDGVEVGNRLVVTRQGDPWRKTLKQKEERFGVQVPETHPIAADELPAEVVGEVHVLYVRPEISTALIIGSAFELNPGDHVEMRAGY